MVVHGDTLNVSGTPLPRNCGSQTLGWSSKIGKSSRAPVFRGTHRPAGLCSMIPVTMIPPASQPRTRSNSRVCCTVDTTGWTSRWHKAPRASICAGEDITSASPVVSTSTYSSLAGRRRYQITSKLPTFKICFCRTGFRSVSAPPLRLTSATSARRQRDVVCFSAQGGPQ